MSPPVPILPGLAPRPHEARKLQSLLPWTAAALAAGAGIGFVLGALPATVFVVLSALALLGRTVRPRQDSRAWAATFSQLHRATSSRAADSLRGILRCTGPLSRSQPALCAPCELALHATLSQLLALLEVRQLLGDPRDLARERDRLGTSEPAKSDLTERLARLQELSKREEDLTAALEGLRRQMESALVAGITDVSAVSATIRELASKAELERKVWEELGAPPSG